MSEYPNIPEGYLENFDAVDIAEICQRHLVDYFELVVALVAPEDDEEAEHAFLTKLDQMFASGKLSATRRGEAH